jgi:two-component system NtrC family sensor kinase
VLGGFWTLFSDRVLALLVTDPLALTHLQTYKGWFYVAATAALLYVLIRRFAEERRYAGEALRAAVRKAEEEQARTTALIAAMGDGISIQDADFRILFQNQKHRDLMGVHVGELCYAAYQHGDQVCGGCPVALSYRDGGIHTVERTAATANGTHFAEVTASSVRDADNRIVAGIEIVRNITDRKRTEAALRDSEKKYRDLVDTALVGIYRTTTSGQFLFANEALARMFEYDSPEQLIAAGTAADHYENPAQREALLAALRQTGTVANFELELKTRSGAVKNVLISATVDNDTLSGMILDITDRKEADDFVKNVLEAVDEAFIVIDRNFRVLLANHAYAAQVRMEVDDIIGRHCYEVSHKQQQPCYETGEECTVRKTFETGNSYTAVHTHHDSQGEAVYVETKSFAMRDKAGTVVSAIEIIHNITARRKLEEQLNQAQKMEAVGTLTGGIAHDFNNILTAVLGYADILKRKLQHDGALAAVTDHIAAAAKRGANLTKSLLAFSRKQAINPGPVDLNEIVSGVEKLLLRIIGEDVELITTPAAGELMVMADRGQTEQILMNLCSNARDAMPNGGILSIATERVDLDDHSVRERGLGKPGSYGLLSVADSGTGMDERTREKIFDPFYTTKEVGKGTGLGLSIVYGIVKQHGGFVEVASKPGDGSTFKVYLPMILFPASAMKQAAASSTAARGTETILVAEDSPEVLRMASSALQDAGYQVIEAVDGNDALRKYAAYGDRIHLLLLDVVMPKKNGREVYDAAVSTRPGIKVLFMSGYTADLLDSKRVLAEGHDFLSKPFLPRELVTAVRAALDRKPDERRS